MVKGIEEVAESWGAGGRIAWIGFALTYLLLLRLRSCTRKTTGRTRRVLFERERCYVFAGERQVKAGDSPGVDTLEVRFKESEGDQGRKRAVLERTKGEGRRGGEEVELLQELYQINVGRAELPLMAFHSVQGVAGVDEEPGNTMPAPRVVRGG